MKQFAWYCLIGSIVGFGMSGYLLMFPEKDMKVDPLTTLMVTGLIFSSGAGTILSIAELRRDDK